MKKISKILLAFVGFLCIGILAACGKIEIKLSTENNVKLVKPGQSVQLVTTVEKGKGDAAHAEYMVVSGDASVSKTGLLTVKETAEAGSVIKVKSKLNSVESNVLEITVDRIAVESITITPSATIVEPGAMITLAYTLTPANTTDKNVTWSLVSGSDIANIITENGSKMLYVKPAANKGDIVVVKAAVGDKTTEVTITVGEATSTIRQISVDSEITLDVNNSAITLTPELIRLSDGSAVAATFDAVIAAGGENIVEVVKSEDGKSFTFNIKGHGETSITISCPGLTGVAPQTVKVNAIVPPSSILMPGYLDGKSTYTVGKSTTGNIQGLPFIPVGVKGNGYNSVSDKYTYSFKLNGVTDPTCAEYENGKLIFKKEGTIEVTITSASGSKDAANNSKEVSATYTFVVNGYKNAYTYEEFKQILQSEKTVNIIVTEKPAEGYGYELVPEFILNLNGRTSLNADEEAAIFQQANAARIFVEPKRTITSTGTIVDSVVINGNGHGINVSKLPVFKTALGSQLGPLVYIDPAEYYVDNNGTKVADVQNLPKDPTAFLGDTTTVISDTTVYPITINDLYVEGNTPTKGATDAPSDAYGSTGMGQLVYLYTYREGIRIGQDRKMKYLHVEMNNVTVSKFNVGMRICHTVDLNGQNSVLNNVMITDIYKVGIEFCASQIDLKNCSFGLCGQGPLEMTADSPHYAGKTFKEVQVVNVVGSFTMKPEAICDYNTPFFTSYIGTSALVALTGALAEQKPLQGLVIDNSRGIGFVGLITADGNPSELHINGAKVSAPDESSMDFASKPIIVLPLSGKGQVCLINFSVYGR